MQGRQAGHSHSQSQSGQVNQRALLANAYNELGKELASEKIKVVGNYTLGRVIGEGAYGKVRLGTHRLTSTRVAVKQIPKALSASLTREIHHHRRLHHPNVTQLYEIIATETSIWLVTELCSGGELYDYLAEKGRLSEEESRKLFGELCLAVNYIHEMGVVHRDLKLENVLLDERCHIKLGDFGFTREFEQGRLLETFCGTTGYAAPEMLACKKYTGQEVDVWSLGIILYTLLVGTLPFDDDDEEEMKHKILLGHFDNPEWLSTDARDLINGILQPEPSRRLSVPQMLAHPWFTRPRLSYEDVPTMDLSASDSQTNIIDLTQDEHLQNHFPLSSTAPVQVPSAPLHISTSKMSAISSQERPLSASVTSDATFHSARSTSESHSEADDPPTPEDETAIRFDDARTAESMESGTGGPESRQEVVVRREESQHTLRTSADEDVLKKPPSQSMVSHNPFSAISGEEPGGPRRADTELQFLDHAQSTERRASAGTSRTPSRGSFSSIMPPLPTRTPVRTKRRSVSSNLTNSPPTSPTVASPVVSSHMLRRLDYLAEMNQKAPLAFSTLVERNLLSSLSIMGFNTAQLVHSVLTDACDAAGALWWMLKKKAEKKELELIRQEAERSRAGTVTADKSESRKATNNPLEMSESRQLSAAPSTKSSPPATIKVSDGINKPRTPAVEGDSARSFVPQPTSTASTSSLNLAASSSNSVPEFAFVPPTPGFVTNAQLPEHPKTPPPNPTGTFPMSFHNHPQQTSPVVGPTKSPILGASAPSSPDRKGSGRGAKPRTGSVSMLQRATTALSVAALTRKKSDERVRDKEKEKEKEKEKNETAKAQTRGSGVAEEPRPTPHVPNKLTKSPPTRDRERENSVSKGGSASSQNSGDQAVAASHITPGSPWAMPDAPQTRNSSSMTQQPIPALAHSASQARMAPTHVNSSGNTLANSPVSSFGKAGGMFTGMVSPDRRESVVPPSSTSKGRSNRASLISAFRMWFYEDKKKRKRPLSTLPSIPAGIASPAYTHPYAPNSSAGLFNSKSSPYPGGSTRSAAKISAGGGTTRAQKRSSVSSRRSSSVNSRRSSMNSVRMGVGSPHDHSGGMGSGNGQSSHGTPLVTRQRSDASRRSIGSRTPTSEFGSRPSSIRSFHVAPITPRPNSGAGQRRRARRSKSPSSSSAGSAPGSRASGRRMSSPLQQYHRRAGSGSSATKVVRHHKTIHTNTRSNHIRSSSAASSVHSHGSSRPPSLHEISDEDMASISRTDSPALFSRRSSEEQRRASYTTTIIVAHRKQSPFTNPLSIGKSSWKKSWGAEPPGWSTRSLPAHREHLSDSSRSSIRDVFAGKTSVNLGDESDWVDEDEDSPAFVGGIGQAPANVGNGNRPRSQSLGANPSGSFPSSPSFKNKDLPPLFASRNRTAAPSRRNHKPTKGQDNLKHTHSPPNATLLGEVSEEQEDALQDAPGSSSRSRRQLPAGRNGPAFRHAIQEEDEDEEA